MADPMRKPFKMSPATREKLRRVFDLVDPQYRDEVQSAFADFAKEIQAYSMNGLAEVLRPVLDFGSASVVKEV